ncbi:MAG: GIY-YIG nuclease family protein, partial [Oscillospiraceae bacterium]|nr:GIY-YIG nuclease family protein [Oscillospiraceae bacterium]
MTQWTVYVLRCADGTLYTGMTDDAEKRLKTHNAGKGAKYTRSRTPVEMVYSESCADKSAALRREHAIKNLTRKQKLQLIEKPAFNISGAAEKAIGMLRE